jgi:hypothetical protein
METSGTSLFSLNRDFPFTLSSFPFPAISISLAGEIPVYYNGCTNREKNLRENSRVFLARWSRSHPKRGKVPADYL